MNKWRALFIIFIAILAGKAFGQDEGNCSLYEEPGDFSIWLCAVSLPPIQYITISETTEATRRLQDPGCDTFKPDIPTLRRYFAKARRVRREDWMNLLDWVHCDVYGTMIFSNGQRAGWSVGPTQMGTIVFQDESEKETGRILLYCPECNFRPFW